MFFRTVSRRVGGRQRRLRLDEPRQQEFGHLGRGFRGPVRAQRDRVDQRLDHREHGRFRRRREAPLGLDVQVQRRDRRKRRLRAVGDAQHARTARRATGQFDGVLHVARKRERDHEIARVGRVQPPRRVRRAAEQRERLHVVMADGQPVLHQPGEKRARPRAENQHAPRADDRLDRGLDIGCVQLRTRVLDVRDGLVEYRVDPRGAAYAGLLLLRGTQPLDRPERRLETTHERRAHRRIAVETERLREAVRGRDRRIHGLREFVDAHRRRAERIREHELAHAAVDRRHQRHRRRDPLGDRGAVGTGVGRNERCHAKGCCKDDENEFTQLPPRKEINFHQGCHVPPHAFSITRCVHCPAARAFARDRRALPRTPRGRVPRENPSKFVRMHFHVDRIRIRT